MSDYARSSAICSIADTKLAEKEHIMKPLISDLYISYSYAMYVDLKILKINKITLS
jgi:hypothetical protein